MCLDKEMDTDSNVKAIEDFIFNEDKLVTYKWLCSELNIHINAAKELLNGFIHNCPDKESLLITYVISGFPSVGNGLSITLVREEDLDKARKNYKQIISEHVYSVQKGKTLSSLNDIYIADIDLKEPNQKFRSIHIDGDILRSDAEPVKASSTTSNEGKDKKNHTSKSSNKVGDKANSGNQLKKETTGSKNAEDQKNKKRLENSTNTNEKKISSKEVSEESKEALQERSTQQNKKAKEPSPKKTDKKAPAKKGGPLSKGGGIGAFFSRQTAKNEEKKKEKKKEAPIVEQPNELKAVGNGKPPNVASYKKDSDPVNRKKNSDEAKNHAGKPSQTKRKKSSEDVDQSHKRRKRIVIASDSESDNEDMEEDEEPEPLSPPPIELIPGSKPESDEEVIPPTPSEKVRKRVRKQIDKTFTDEEGFIITKKEYVYESCSDDETTNSDCKRMKETVKTQKKPSPEKTSPKNNNSPQKNKQPSIMNFFRKK